MPSPPVPRVLARGGVVLGMRHPRTALWTAAVFAASWRGWKPMADAPRASPDYSPEFGAGDIVETTPCGNPHHNATAAQEAAPNRYCESVSLPVNNSG